MKSVELVPPMAMLVMVMAVLPRFDKVSVIGELEVPTAVVVKVKLAGLNLIAVPVPLKAEVWVPALSTTLSVAD